MADEIVPRPTLAEDIRSAINRHSRENTSATPDFILAEYILASLAAFETAVCARRDWWGGHPAEHEKTLALAPADRTSAEEIARGIVHAKDQHGQYAYDIRPRHDDDDDGRGRLVATIAAAIKKDRGEA